MNKEEIREYCLSKPGVTESLPFNDTALVFKVMDKMFALPDLSEDLKRNWNKIFLVNSSFLILNVYIYHEIYKLYF